MKQLMDSNDCTSLHKTKLQYTILIIIRALNTEYLNKSHSQKKSQDWAAFFKQHKPHTHKAVSTDHNFRTERRAEADSNRGTVPLLTSLTPYR